MQLNLNKDNLQEIVTVILTKKEKMLVPGHVVSMYVATGGSGGLSLGSDEKEIVLLVFVIIDDRTQKVSQNFFFYLKKNYI